MRQQNPAQSRAMFRGWTWPSALLNVDVLALCAALGLIAAIAFGAPHLRPL